MTPTLLLRGSQWVRIYCEGAFLNFTTTIFSRDFPNIWTVVSVQTSPSPSKTINKKQLQLQLQYEIKILALNP
jgi:hypothetical protein